MANNEKLTLGLNLKELTNFDIGDIEDQDMISRDFRKATLITLLSIASAGILTIFFYLL